MKGVIKAVLGATNTGKTHSAIERMQRYSSGVIGFPLRLLARENFEKGQKIFGKKNVALITGEEKIIPKTAKYFFCTVESMPKKSFEFAAVDEVQLASNFERGHHFTDKILNFRGTQETWFLGSNSIKKILKLLFPKIVIINKSRLSNLKYYGYKNLTRLPKRSAVIAFSQIEIYSLAEKLKKFKGGVSIITGALSPETRNKQLNLFESGEVDYIVATDAIGLGLNLDIRHVFFSNIVKFDGQKQRYLSLDEISQIAGRAGRNLNDGYFGVTENLKKFNDEQVEYIENYKFSELNFLYWRNSDLDFSSSKNLIRSLSKKPTHNKLVLKRKSDDIESLKILAQDRGIKKKIENKKFLKLMWDICNIPNYTKVLVEQHAALLKQIAHFLILEQKQIPQNLVKLKVNNFLRGNNNISDINLKIAKIRIWAYISYKNDWVEKSTLMQSKIKKIEEILSTKLHQSLTKRFVDDLYFENRYFPNNENNQPIYVKNFKIYVNKKIIGEIDGFNLKLYSEIIARRKEIFFQKFLKNKIDLIINELISNFVRDDNKNINFDLDGKISWRGSLVGFFVKGDSVYTPFVKICVDHNYDNEKKNKIKKRLEEYLIFLKEKYVDLFSRILKERKINNHTSSFRALSFVLYENLGYCYKEKYISFYNNLSDSEINFFKKLGLRIGTKFIYFRNENFEKKYFNNMLTSVFNKYKLDKNLNKRLLFKSNIILNDKIFIQNSKKLGFYKIKILKKEYFIYFLLYEKLYTIKNLVNKKNQCVPNHLRKYCEYDNFFLKNFFKTPALFLKENQIIT